MPHAVPLRANKRHSLNTAEQGELCSNLIKVAQVRRHPWRKLPHEGFHLRFQCSWAETALSTASAFGCQGCWELGFEGSHMLSEHTSCHAGNWRRRHQARMHAIRRIGSQGQGICVQASLAKQVPTELVNAERCGASRSPPCSGAAASSPVSQQLVQPCVWQPAAAFPPPSPGFALQQANHSQPPLLL